MDAGGSGVHVVEMEAYGDQATGASSCNSSEEPSMKRL